MAMNISTESLARASATHPWRVIGIWVVVVVTAMVVISAFLEDGLTTAFVFTNDPEVQHGEKLLEEIRGPKGTNEVVVFESTKYTVDDPEYKRAVEALTADLAELGPEIIRLETLENFYNTGAPPLVSADRTATLIGFVMAGTSTQIPTTSMSSSTLCMNQRRRSKQISTLRSQDRPPSAWTSGSWVKRTWKRGKCSAYRSPWSFWWWCWAHF